MAYYTTGGEFFLPPGPGKFMGKLGDGRSSHLKGLLLSRRTEVNVININTNCFQSDF